MTTAKIWQIIIGAACIVGLLLPQESAASQTNMDDIYSIAWRPDGLQIATGHALGTVRLWDAKTGELLNTFKTSDRNFGFPPQIDDVAWHPDGTRIAVATSSSTYFRAFLLVMDATTGEILHDLDSGSSIHDTAWSPDGTLLAGAIIKNLRGPAELTEYKVNIWDLATEQLVAELEADSVIFTLAWSPNGNWLASVGWSQTIIWDTQTWTPLLQIGEPPNMPTTLWVTWSPDSTRVATPGVDGLAYIWDATTGNLLMTMQSGDEEQLYQLEWQPGGNLLVGRNDHALIYWDATTGQQIDRMDTSEWIGYVAWSPDGSQLLYSDHSIEHPLFAQIPNVPSPSNCTATIAAGDVAGLTSAINAANANADPNTLCLVAGSTYTLPDADSF